VEGESWDVNRPIQNLDELLVALGFPDLSYLDDYIDSRLDHTYGDDCEFGDDYFVLFSSAFGPIHHSLNFPMTLEQFEKSMTELDWRMHWMYLALNASQDPDDFISEADTTARLAAFFDSSPVDFARTVGGGWYPVDGSQLVGHNQTPYAWFGAGEPVQVILGLGEEYVSVLTTGADEYGLEVGEEVSGEPYVDVVLREASTVPSLGEAVSEALNESRRNWDYCAGCRAHTVVSEVKHPSGRFCESCEIDYGLATPRRGTRGPTKKVGHRPGTADD
jgi:hypothetical protein